jgi:hypothetical protein
MTQDYNPIIRTFCRLRREFVNGLGVARRQVHPCTPIATLIPLEKRREFCHRLWLQGFYVTPGLSKSAMFLSTLLVLAPSAVFAFCLQSWLAACITAPIGFVVFRANRRWAVHFPDNGPTVGWLAFCSTRPDEHPNCSGWSSREYIFRKVQLVLAESLNIDPIDIKPDSTLRELGAV